MYLLMLHHEFQVGVLAIRGIPASYTEFNQTFNHYLNCEVS